jgi:hypothetical protein
MPSRFDQDGFLRQEGKVLSSVEKGPGEPAAPGRPGYLRSPLWAAGFSFSDAAVLHEVPYSPFLPHLFFGEELGMAAR